jgi:hypothetical protein
MNHPPVTDTAAIGDPEMTDLIEHIRGILEHHRRDDGSDAGCRCGAEGLSDHSGHVAQEIVDRLSLRREALGKQIRYVGAWFNNELTILEGAE